ncbi:MAG: Rid family detoxifying hydrolase [Anaerolineae bacterium]|jgi:2-iminobutanoate/2-iminopropanoate deaminase|nr:Rid family detoxifying hydrolase [Anaerolineae bacterium]
MKTAIATTSAPAAIGPYSQGIRAGDFIFCSGQTGLDPATGILREGLEAQTEQVLDNLAAVLAAAGASFDDVVKTTIFLVDMADFQTVNALYGKRFSGILPARTTVAAKALPKGGLVEIDMVAYVPQHAAE